MKATMTLRRVIRSAAAVVKARAVLAATIARHEQAVRELNRETFGAVIAKATGGSPLKHRMYAVGTHWTQKPGNRARLLRMVKRNAQKRLANAAAIKKPHWTKKPEKADPATASAVVSRGPKRKGLTHHRGAHWTQKPENQRKLQRMARKAALERKRRVAEAQAAPLF